MKDAYYFPHFCNARHDRKIRRLRKELGIEGYGIFFMLLEVLREQPEYRFPFGDIDLLADEFETSEPKIRTAITNYDLFTIDELNNFFSSNLVIYLQPYHERKEKARNAAKKRWEKKEAKQEVNAQEMLEHNSSNTQGMQSKVKKSKVKKEYIVELVNHLNHVAGRNYSCSTQKTVSLLSARLKQSSVEEIKKVIDKKVKEWKGTEMEIYLRPETLFNATKFEGYINEPDNIHNIKKKEHYINYMQQEKGCSLVEAEERWKRTLEKKAKGG